MGSKRRIPIDRRDYDRILITETLPYETPVIFSAEGFYSQVKALDSMPLIQRKIVECLVKGIGGEKSKVGTVPFHYKIRKNAREYRRLSVVHPRAQWRFKEFYERFEGLLLHYCSESKASIRAPTKVAGSFYKKSSWEEIYKYKTGGVASATIDELAKHIPSYFAYRGHDRLYKFFESQEYLDLEKRYELMWTLDVSKCFDSIYTHSLAWAVKEKQFIKEHLQASTFAERFDDVMRYANHNETNGIVIGPEVSRIFAEVLFQEVDLQVVDRLKKKGLLFGSQYAVRRYVDDIFIFASDEDVTKVVYDTYADVLLSFNLHANAAKSLRFVRPFTTEKSRLIDAANAVVAAFLGKFLESSNGSTALVPRPIHSQWRLTRSFINGVKATCAAHEASYDDVASYLIAVLSERVKKLAGCKIDKGDAEAKSDYSAALKVLLEATFFLYGVAPSVSASYKVCASTILAIRFARKYLGEHQLSLSQRIFELTLAHLEINSKGSSEDVEVFVPLETLNLLLAASELGSDYLIPEDSIAALFTTHRRLSYFQVTCYLYYVKDSPEYEVSRKQVLSQVTATLADLSDLLVDSEKAYLFLDMLSCPFVDTVLKRKWIRDAFEIFQCAKPTKAEVTSYLASAPTAWHTDWAGVDLLNLLERKELRQVY